MSEQEFPLEHDPGGEGLTERERDRAGAERQLGNPTNEPSRGTADTSDFELQPERAAEQDGAAQD